MKEQHYRDRILNGEKPMDVVSEFVFYAIDNLYITNTRDADREFCEKFKAMNRAARSIAIVSHGLEKGYILCEEWFQIVYVQFALAGAKAFPDWKSKYVDETIRKRWAKMGFDVEKAINPIIDEYSYAVPVKHEIEGGGFVEYIMRYTLPRDIHGYIDKFTKGTMIEGERGGMYTVRRRELDGVVVVWSDATGTKDIRKTKKQMDKMTVLFSGYLLGEL